MEKILMNRIMKNRGNYFYVKKLDLKTNFTQIPNQLFNIDLTATEKLILIYLLSNAESFRITIYRIAKSIGSDHRTIKKALKKFRDMELLNQVTNRTISINIDEIIRLAAVPTEIEKSIDDGNTTNSTITHNCNSPGSNSTTIIGGQLPLNDSNSPTRIPVDVPNNNTKQEEIKEEKQKEVSSSFSAIDVAKEVDDYLLIPSQFFYANNQINCSRIYERYRVEISDPNIKSILQFETALFYHLLKITNSPNVQDLNKILSNGRLSIGMSEIRKTIKLIKSNKEINEDYQKEVKLVRDKLKDENISSN
jgi:hypothetical protein